MIELYSDGAYSSSRNSGGWSFIVLNNDAKIYSAFDTVKNTTNNRMEILAAIEAIQWGKDNNYFDITLYTDSMYVIGTMTLNYKRNKNLDMWEIMDKVVEGINVNWKHVKGHSDNRWNQMCDLLAVTASQM